VGVPKWYLVLPAFCIINRPTEGPGGEHGSITKKPEGSVFVHWGLNAPVLCPQIPLWKSTTSWKGHEKKLSFELSYWRGLAPPQWSPQPSLHPGNFFLLSHFQINQVTTAQRTVIPEFTENDPRGSSGSTPAKPKLAVKLRIVLFCGIICKIILKGWLSKL
jgi:hypothetical protein